MKYHLYRISHITCIPKLFYLHVLQSSQSIYIVADDLNNTEFVMYFALVRMVISISELYLIAATKLFLTPYNVLFPND